MKFSIKDEIRLLKTNLIFKGIEILNHDKNGASSDPTETPQFRFACDDARHLGQIGYSVMRGLMQVKNLGRPVILR